MKTLKKQIAEKDAQIGDRETKIYQLKSLDHDRDLTEEEILKRIYPHLHLEKGAAVPSLAW